MVRLDSLQNPTLWIIIILGSLVIGSYKQVLGDWMRGSISRYATHPFWFGLNTEVVHVLLIFQVFAAIGFIISATSWIISPPISGFFGIYTKHMLPIVMSIFLISAISWPYSTYHNYSTVSVISLIVTAICSILLVAGAAEEESPRWWVVLGWILLSCCTVIGDGVIWNANYILHRTHI